MPLHAHIHTHTTCLSAFFFSIKGNSTTSVNTQTVDKLERESTACRLGICICGICVCIPRLGTHTTSLSLLYFSLLHV